MKDRRSRKEMKADQRRHYDGMSENRPINKAKAQMKHKPYAAMLIREQGQQMEGREHGESKTTERKEI